MDRLLGRTACSAVWWGSTFGTRGADQPQRVTSLHLTATAGRVGHRTGKPIISSVSGPYPIYVIH
ncbi:MAG TPA: hypothetical protein ENL34_11180 [Chloroflexi bacterium]|nr:hypothetical protein [Chloroflexota bacterium]